MRSESDLYGPTHATKTLARLGLAIVALWILCLVGMAALGGSAARGEEPPAKAVEKAFDKAAACKVVDDAFAKAARKNAPAPKPAAKAVEDAFEAAKAKKQPDAKNPAAPERLPMPRQVTLNEWFIDCPAVCEECKWACACVDCVCQSTQPSAKPAGNPADRYVMRVVDTWAEKPKAATGGIIRVWATYADGSHGWETVDTATGRSVQSSSQGILDGCPVGGQCRSSQVNSPIISNSCPGGQCQPAARSTPAVWTVRPSAVQSCPGGNCPRR